MHIDSAMHIIVFVVNILSFRKYQVMTGNAIYDAAKARNRELQSAPVSSTQNFVPYKKHMPTGIE